MRNKKELIVLQLEQSLLKESHIIRLLEFKSNRS